MNQKQIIKYLRYYSDTGVVPDALIPYYDQHGIWRGDTIRWNHPPPESLLLRIKDTRLSESRRTNRSPMGPILLTSWYTDSEEAVCIKYTEIKGSLIAHGNNSVQAASLRYIGGHCSAATTKIIYFPSLVHVGGNLEVSSSFRLQAPRLRAVKGRMKIAGEVPPMLEFVGGSLSTFWAFHFHAPQLRYVGGTLIPHKAELVSAPLLESIKGGLLLADTNKRADLPKLRSIGEDFLASSTKDIRAPLLRWIGCDMDTRAAKQYYHPRIRVGGNWTCNPEAVHDWMIREKARQALRHHGDLPEL